MPNSKSEHMSWVDNFWLRLDRPYNHMTISSVMILSDRLDRCSGLQSKHLGPAISAFFDPN